jgi:flagellar biosynthesis chaperone FliJ
MNKDNTMVKIDIDWIVIFLLLTVSLFSLSGCDGQKSHSDNVDRQSSKSEIEKLLELTTKERDALKLSMNRISDSFETAKEELAALSNVRDELQSAVDAGQAKVTELQTNLDKTLADATGFKDQILSLTEDRDAALASIGSLTGELDAKSKMVSDLQDQVRSLNETVNELKKAAQGIF